MYPAEGINPPAPAPQGSGVLASVPASAPKKRGRRSREEIAKEQGFTLYINCVPIKGNKYDSAADRLARANHVVAAHAGVPHWSMVDMGKGRGMFLAALQVDLQQNVQVNALYLSTLSKDGAEAETLLTAMASEVIRAS
jgi:hypothetical protein